MLWMLRDKWFIMVLVLLNVGCDQVSKSLIRKHVVPRDYIRLVEDAFIMTNVENTGAMLGFGQNFTPALKIILLQLLPLLVLLFLLYRILVRTQLSPWMAVAFSFVIGGGIGNLIDRIRYGSVTDFLQLRLGFLQTGIFNMADVSVSLGVILILVFTLFGQKSAL